jgi:hypothetical protein
MGRSERAERGSATLFVLGLCVAVLFLGGIGIDLWRAIAVRRELVALADAVATAAANGIDPEALRAGDLVLDEDRVRAIAADALARHDASAGLEGAAVSVAGGEVVVVVEDRVRMSLLALLAPGEPFRVRVRAHARPEERA